MQPEPDLPPRPAAEGPNYTAADAERVRRALMEGRYNESRGPSSDTDPRGFHAWLDLKEHYD